VRLDPRQFQRLNTLGLAYVHAGQHEEAIPVFKQVLTYNPNFWPAHWGLAVSSSELGQEEGSSDCRSRNATDHAAVLY
jgi:Flp pilus assembly protein TadD